MGSTFDCHLHGEACKHCYVHKQELIRNGELPEDLEYHEGVWPVMFNCQFIYRYEEDLATYAENLHNKVAETLSRRFKERVPVFADFRAHKNCDIDPYEKPSVQISLLVDFPRYVNIDGEVIADMFDGRTPSLEDWEAREFVANDHFSLTRLRWFMSRAGVEHWHWCNEGTLWQLSQCLRRS